MIGRKELWDTFENEKFVTKKIVMEKLHLKSYKDVQKYFVDLNHIGRRYYTADVIDRMLEYVEYR